MRENIKLTDDILAESREIEKKTFDAFSVYLTIWLVESYSKFNAGHKIFSHPWVFMAYLTGIHSVG